MSKWAVTVWLFLLLTVFLFCLSIDLQGRLPLWLQPFSLGYRCAFAGGIGGCAYCLRAVYLRSCVFKDWGNDWLIWYFIRPVVSVLCGAISCVILLAGLLVLDSDQRTNGSDFGFYALAIISGYNVDKFLAKIEDIAFAVWGIQKSRSASSSDQDQPCNPTQKED